MNCPDGEAAPTVNLPRLIVLTDGSQTGGRDLIEVVGSAVAGGARAVVLREKNRPRSERAALAAELGALLDAVGGSLLVASDSTIAAGGLHLAAADPFPSPAPALLGRSCHDRESLAAAAAEGCSYAFVSPVFATASKPGYGPALGLGLLAASPLPTWALGGITTANAEACMAAGAAGVAVMGEIMRAGDPGEAVAAILAVIDHCRPGATRPRSGGPDRGRDRRRAARRGPGRR